jgi:hypothetical protein
MGKFVFAVFPLSVKSTELEITVTWQEEGVRRDKRIVYI